MKKKQTQIGKLGINKFQISKINNPHLIYGGNNNLGELGNGIRNNDDDDDDDTISDQK